MIIFYPDEEYDGHFLSYRCPIIISGQAFVLAALCGGACICIVRLVIISSIPAATSRSVRIRVGTQIYEGTAYRVQTIVWRLRVSSSASPSLVEAPD